MGVSLEQKLLKTVDGLLAQRKNEDLVKLLARANYQDIAFVIDNLNRGKRKIFTTLSPLKQSQVVLCLSENSQESILPRLKDKSIARFLDFNEEDDAVDILQFLPLRRYKRILSNLNIDKQKKIQQLFYFDPETAGGLMDLNYSLIDISSDVKDLANKLKSHIANTKKTPFIIATDKNKQILGYIPYKKIILASGDISIEQLLQTLPLVSPSTDQEEVLQIAQNSQTEAIGVVDGHQKLIGIIHLPDLLRVAQEEATEDIFQFAGVSEEESVSDGILRKVKNRYGWLIINLGTAFLASMVVAMFEGTIAKMAILAVYMPIVAGQGGNAATQALAVVVRGLALGDIEITEAKKIIIREACAGTINGLIVGIIAALVAFLLNAPIIIGLVLGAAMIINLFVAGFFGAIVPFILKWRKIDPAIASSIFVTTATDIFGFLAFLGLARIFINP